MTDSALKEKTVEVIIKNDKAITVSPEGQQVPAQIIEVNAEKVVVDLNHPLAGETLTFEIEVVGISETPTQVQSGCGCGCECSADSC